MNNQAWCEHIKAKDGEHNLLYYHDNESGLFYTGTDERWMWCPICGAKRPDRKSLAQELMDAYMELTTWGNVADKARSYILDRKENGIIKILEEFSGNRYSGSFKSISESILDYLRESSK